jgi:hypothetical protein
LMQRRCRFYCLRRCLGVRGRPLRSAHLQEVWIGKCCGWCTTRWDAERATQLAMVPVSGHVVRLLLSEETCRRAAVQNPLRARFRTEHVAVLGVPIEMSGSPTIDGTDRAPRRNPGLP